MVKISDFGTARLFDLEYGHRSGAVGGGNSSGQKSPTPGSPQNCLSNGSGSGSGGSSGVGSGNAQGSGVLSAPVFLPQVHPEFTTGVGTLLWCAPEILKRQPYGLPADIYSFAIVMFVGTAVPCLYLKLTVCFANLGSKCRAELCLSRRCASRGT